MNPTNQELPYELNEYIREQVNQRIETNSCDNKPTSQKEIDEMVSTAIRLYEAG
jgi:hypothetical protein